MSVKKATRNITMLAVEKIVFNIFVFMYLNCPLSAMLQRIKYNKQRYFVLFNKKCIFTIRLNKIKNLNQFQCTIIIIHLIKVALVLSARR